MFTSEKRHIASNLFTSEKRQIASNLFTSEKRHIASNLFKSEKRHIASNLLTPEKRQIASDLFRWRQMYLHLREKFRQIYRWLYDSQALVARSDNKLIRAQGPEF